MAATFEKIHVAIGARIEATWAAYAPIFAENAKETRPADATWVRWSVRPADSYNADVSATFERSVGLIFFQIFTPENAGTRGAFKARDKIAAMFNEKRLPTTGGGVIRCDRAKLDYAGKMDGWTQHNVTVQYLHDDVALNAA